MSPACPSPWPPTFSGGASVLQSLDGRKEICARFCFAWGAYPVGKARAFVAGNDKLATQNVAKEKADGRITSAEVDLRKACAV
jgi:hypothetical protein